MKIHQSNKYGWIEKRPIIEAGDIAYDTEAKKYHRYIPNKFPFCWEELSPLELWIIEAFKDAI